MKHIRLAPYAAHLYLSTDLAEFTRIVEKKSGYTVGTPAGMSWHDARGNFYVGIFDTDRACSIGTLVHELSHVMLDLCCHIGYNPSTQQEPFCYMMDYMLMACIKACPEITQ